MHIESVHMESCVLIKETQWIFVLARATIGFELSKNLIV